MGDKYTARNSHDASNIARWRRQQEFWEKPGMGTLQNPGGLQHRRDILGLCPECLGESCKRCRRFGFSYRKWVDPTEEG